MRYWEDLTSSKGFDEGTEIPPEAYLSRDVYCRVINILAAQRLSAYRCVPLDADKRNPCRVISVPAGWFNHEYRAWPSRDGLLYAVKWGISAPADVNDKSLCGLGDDGLAGAIDEAGNLCLDNYTVVEAKIRPDLLTLLITLTGLPT